MTELEKIYDHTKYLKIPRGKSLRHEDLTNWYQRNKFLVEWPQVSSVKPFYDRIDKISTDVVVMIGKTGL